MPGKRPDIVAIKRPTKALDARGQLQGQDETLTQEWPCKINTLSGNKAEQARSLVPSVTHSIEGGRTRVPLKQKDYLQYRGRRFDIEFINDIERNGDEVTLLCTEIVLG
jgi:SPP1 family predicted phage head-tail adaptor